MNTKKRRKLKGIRSPVLNMKYLETFLSMSQRSGVATTVMDYLASMDDLRHGNCVRSLGRFSAVGTPLRSVSQVNQQVLTEKHWGSGSGLSNTDNLVRTLGRFIGESTAWMSAQGGFEPSPEVLTALSLGGSDE